jgi:hypothetical protein
VLEAEARGLQQCRQIAHHLLGLRVMLPDTSSPVAGLIGNLTGNEKEIAARDAGE